MMHLLSSQFNLVFKMLGIHMEMVSQIHLGNITVILNFFFCNVIALLFVRLYLFSSVLGLL